MERISHSLLQVQMHALDLYPFVKFNNKCTHAIFTLGPNLTYVLDYNVFGDGRGAAGRVPCL